MIAHLIDEEIFNSNHLLETDDEFIQRICNHIFQEVTHLKKMNDEVFEELEDQVLEVFKIKTYGYLSLQHYRKVHRPKARGVG